MADLKTYLVNEIYYTIQGEGVRYGTPHVFVRLAQCNLGCHFCDTEMESYREMTADEILLEADMLTTLAPQTHRHLPDARKNPVTVERQPCRNVLFCGGEPLLQLDTQLVKLFKDDGWFIAVETNGSRQVPEGVDWVTCSPKVAEHAIIPQHVNELKYVRAKNQGIPRPAITADHYLISPMFEGNQVDQETVEWCLLLVLHNPQWRLTVQHHKTTFGGVR